jgi:hypothetical protein
VASGVEQIAGSLLRRIKQADDQPIVSVSSSQRTVRPVLAVKSPPGARAHEARLAKSPHGLVHVTIGMLRIRHRLRTLAISDLVQLAGELAEATELCRVFYKEEGHDGADPLPADIAVPDRANLPRDLIFGVMISGVFAVASRGAITKQVVEIWQAGAAEAHLSAMLDFLVGDR